MIRITQIKVDAKLVQVSPENEIDYLIKAVSKALRVDAKEIETCKIVKKSIDARKKPELNYIYTVDILINDEEAKLKRSKNPNASLAKDNLYQYTLTGTKPLKNRPVVIGTGPAGLFCAYLLAKEGFRPIVLERGYDVDKRVEEVNRFWETNQLNQVSNVQFGEGGAGTFSDGKLNTVVKDALGRHRFVFETFVKHGAPEEILYQNKPHIGTDRLREVVKNMRKQILDWGGEVRFESQVTDFIIKDDKINGVIVNHKEAIDAEVVVLAIGHSARDTFETLYNKGFAMEKKPFAIGVRVEHPQDIINSSQYGNPGYKMPAADYKLTYQASNKRGVYSFCMCPGGFVVNASSEEGHLVVNGMSNYLRDEKNANSAIIVTVTPEDFDSEDPLAGVHFQRKWEKAAYEAAKGLVPIQLYGDLKENKVSTELRSVTPNIRGQYGFADLRNCLPKYVIETILEGMEYFDSKIKGFANPDAVLIGVETRTSSPVRIVRDEMFESNIKGLYPCGEGAGYAGGITSAAMDGMKTFENIRAVKSEK